MLTVAGAVTSGGAVAQDKAAQEKAAQAKPADSPQFDAAALEFFEKEVRPLLANRCYECHSRD
ncbi:MAG TPA: hypothetical protein PLV92_28550, partial [Pirellulaceae bacterium]|nr:hypothetical protein [Pirellulaceae bacterium]